MLKDTPARRRLGIKRVQQRYDRSGVTIWTWYTEKDFPRPHYLNGIRQWWEDELDAWDSKHAQSYEQHRRAVR